MKYQELDAKTHEIITILSEEAAEVIREVSKTIRFGLDDRRKNLLEQEIGDLLTMVDLLQLQGVISAEGLAKAKQAKIQKLKQWSSIYE
jgi:NTP pyrophosphatase (non-canonical NTP hydrolase)